MKKPAALLIGITLLAVIAAGVQTLRLRRAQQPSLPRRETTVRYARENERDRGKVDIVFLGDSVTDNWDDAGEFFPGLPYANRGIAGQATPEMLLRFRRDVVELRPMAVVIMAGAGDIASGLPLEETRRNLASMADIARAHEIDVVFASNLPAGDQAQTGAGERPPARLDELNAWIKGYALSTESGFVDYRPAVSDERGALRREFSEDGVHLNARGYAALREVFTRFDREASGGNQ
ncbi:MAG TPA: GDSL-type esterase/lipase family protein [Pyrinomonadaceae bacterium]|jgi:lysophospholipase L1-like esterase